MPEKKDPRPEPRLIEEILADSKKLVEKVRRLGENVKRLNQEIASDRKKNDERMR